MEKEPTSSAAAKQNQYFHGAAVFYDLDMTFVDTGSFYVYLYYALSLPQLPQRMRRVATLALASPVYLAAEVLRRGLASTLFQRSHKGMPADSLKLLGDQLVRDALIPHLDPGLNNNIHTAREAGMKQYIITGAVDTIAQPLADALGLDGAIANRLEIKDGVATGRLVAPALNANNKAAAVEALAKREGIRLDLSYVFGDARSDGKLLDLVAHPIVVNPNRGLRSRAKSHGWPVLQMGRPSKGRALALI